MPKAEDAKKPKDALSPLFPGREVELEVELPTGRSIVVATVYPLGFRHLRRFSKDVTGAINAVVGMRVPENLRSDPAAAAAFTNRVLMQLVPYAIDNLLDLVKECVVFKDGVAEVDDLPHWHVATLVEAWIIESFGEEKKWRPWIAAVENVYAQVTGNRKKITEIFSRDSSSPATDASTS